MANSGKDIRSVLRKPIERNNEMGMISQRFLQIGDSLMDFFFENQFEHEREKQNHLTSPPKGGKT